MEVFSLLERRSQPRAGFSKDENSGSARVDLGIATGGNMAQAIGNPEEIERFAKTLKGFGDTLRGGMLLLRGGQLRLGESWRDQENVRFAQEFEQTLRVLDHFLKASDDQVPHLMRKAARLRDYLNQR